MASSRERLLSAAFFIVSSAAIVSSLFKMSSADLPASASRTDLITTTISALNVPVLWAFLAFGEPAGISSVFLAGIVAVFISLRTGFYEHAFMTLTFFLTMLIVYGYSRPKAKARQSHMLKSEALDEEINLITNEIEKKKNNIASLVQKQARYSALKGVAESLSTTLSMDEIAGLTIEKALGTLRKGARALLFLVDTQRQELELFASKDAGKVMSKKGDMFDQYVLRHRMPLIVDDVTKDFRFPAEEAEKKSALFRSLIAAPLLSENKVIGILRMDSRQESLYTQDDLRLLDIIAGLGAVAMQNALLYSRTEELAIKDGLTGLFLRRYFLERFKEELKRAGRNAGMLSLLMIDIDRFKGYNDQYGHMAGDRILKYLADKLAVMEREGGILARYGGEEIAVLLFGAGKDKALAEAESIRKRIEEEPFVLRRQEVRLTVSIGISNYPKDAVLEEQLIKIADERLYRAKARGRNRVCAD